MFSFLQILYLLLFAKIIIVIMTCYYSNYHYGLLFRGSFFLLHKISFQYRGCFQNTVKQLKLSVLRKQFRCLFRTQLNIYDRTFCDNNYRLRAVSAAYAIYPTALPPTNENSSDAYSEPSQKSKMELFCDNNYRLKAVSTVYAIYPTKYIAFLKTACVFPLAIQNFN